MVGPDRKPLSEDALTRFRITHSDRELRPLLRRLHCYSHLQITAESSEAGSETRENAEREKDLLQLELLKWKGGIERVTANVGNLKRQREVYLKRAGETAAKTESLRSTLMSEKTLLSEKLKERDQQLKCDEVANRILARGKTRKELDEQIALLRQDIILQQSTITEYQNISKARIDAYAQIGPIIEQVRGYKLLTTEVTGGEDLVGNDKMDVDEPQPAGGSKLSVMAIPFQPTTSSTESAPPMQHSHSHASISRTHTNSTTQNHNQNQSHNHGLPARPNSSGSNNRPNSSGGGASPLGRNTSASNRGNNSGNNNSTLPPRPSGLRSSTVQGKGSLEEGELGGEQEDGEVAEEKSRSSRSRGVRK